MKLTIVSKLIGVIAFISLNIFSGIVIIAGVKTQLHTQAPDPFPLSPASAQILYLENNATYIQTIELPNYMLRQIIMPYKLDNSASFQSLTIKLQSSSWTNHLIYQFDQAMLSGASILELKLDNQNYPTHQHQPITLIISYVGPEGAIGLYTYENPWLMSHRISANLSKNDHDLSINLVLKPEFTTSIQPALSHIKELRYFTISHPSLVGKIIIFNLLASYLLIIWTQSWRLTKLQ